MCVARCENLVLEAVQSSPMVFPWCPPWRELAAHSPWQGTLPVNPYHAACLVDLTKILTRFKLELVLIVLKCIEG